MYVRIVGAERVVVERGSGREAVCGVVEREERLAGVPFEDSTGCALPGIGSEREAEEETPTKLEAERRAFVWKGAPALVAGTEERWKAWGEWGRGGEGGVGRGGGVRGKWGGGGKREWRLLVAGGARLSISGF